MNALIIANGLIPTITIVRRLVSSADIIVCADGGANHARTLHLTPNVILGDLDSLSPSTKKTFNHIPLLYIEDQESTDLEKAIEFCIQRNISTVDIIGATGDRLDHTTGSLGCFKKYGRDIELRIIDTVGRLQCINKSITFTANVGEKISLIPLDRCSGVTTKNLKYPLTNAVLELGVREGVSNEAVSSKVTVRVMKGTLLLYRFHHAASAT